MSTPHNNSNKGDITKRVIMAGDPLRVKYIAQNYLIDYKLINDVRGMYAYTGYYNNKRITVMAHGMGNPSIGIYSYELFKLYDVDEIIRIGSCGTFSNKINLKDIFLVEKSYSKSNFAKELNNDERKILLSSKELNDKIIESSKKLDIKLNSGMVFCTDIFYKDEDYLKLNKDKGCMVVEMESFGLFAVASMLNKKASCLLTVSDNLLTGKELSAREREQSFDDMIKVALNIK